MKKIDVKVEKDHLERITSARPLVAISELIWNSYDADASEVRVILEGGPLTKLSKIRVVDNGSGIAFEKAQALFQSLGGSWKKLTQRTEGGRVLHGDKGQGRFKAFALGDCVQWSSRHGGKAFSITGDRSNLIHFTISDELPVSGAGCTVEIDNVNRDFRIWAADGFHEQIRDMFALQIYEDPGFTVIYDGKEIDARESIENVTPYPISAKLEGGQNFKGILEIVEWTRRVDRKLMLCLPGRFSFHSLAAGIHARGFEFTAYLTSDHFQTLANNNTEGLVEA